MKKKRVRFCNHDVRMRTDRVVRNPLASDQFLLAIQALILGPFPWTSTAYLFLLYVLKRTRFVLWQNSIARRSERTTDIQGVKHHTSSWRACSYILGTQAIESQKSLKGNSYLWYFLAWTSFNFLLPMLLRFTVTQCFEELAYFGIQFNLVTFLKTVLHDSNVTAARNYTNWQGTCYIAPLVGAIIADSYLGRYLTTVAFFTVYLFVSTQVSPFKKLSSNCLFVWGIV